MSGMEAYIPHSFKLLSLCLYPSLYYSRGSGWEGEEEKEEKIVLQFNQEQLFGLYTQLEQIQEQLDALR